LKINEIKCEPFDDQRPGTAGLRKKVTVFQQPHYLQCFVQAIFDCLDLPADATLVIGGDGRFFNREAITTIIAMAAAEGVARVVVGQNGWLSTPAASHLIRHEGAAAGLILTASHNPGGPDGDFGLKFNMASGGQAPESLTDAVYERSKTLTGYRIADLDIPDLRQTGSFSLAGLRLDVVDPVDAYTDLMQTLFDFPRIRAMLAGGRRVHFDALNAITGPYAERILCDELGAPRDSVRHTRPLEDFGGLHPDPNPVDAPHLLELALSDDPPDLIAASDGDGDRNMILGPGLMVSPGDSLAIMLEHCERIPGYANGVPGVARSMPTSRAVDAVAEAHGIPCFETPTGWRFFSNLLTAGKIGLCGEESFGTSSSHVGEKDGLWAVLFWLNLMAELEQPVDQIVHAHWARYGRWFFQRRDYFIADTGQAQALIADLGRRLPTLPNTLHGGQRVAAADVFNYTDPVDHSVSRDQGFRVFLEGGGRIVFRLSGTGTAGATLRVYLDHRETGPERVTLPADDILSPLGEAAASIARIADHTGLAQPTAVI
jgi:phosphoglucomutase